MEARLENEKKFKDKNNANMEARAKDTSEDDCGRFHFVGRENINYKADLELEMESCMALDYDFGNLIYTHGSD